MKLFWSFEPDVASLRTCWKGTNKRTNLSTISCQKFANIQQKKATEYGTAVCAEQGATYQAAMKPFWSFKPDAAD